jgi:hypothetical protein
MLYLKPQKQKLAKVVVVYEHLSLLALNHLWKINTHRKKKERTSAESPNTLWDSGEKMVILN